MIQGPPSWGPVPKSCTVFGTRPEFMQGSNADV